MFPSLTYSNEPGTSARGSVTTTFDGVGVRIGPFGPPLPPGRVGSEPPSRAKLTRATTTSPANDSAGAASNGRRRPPTGAAGRWRWPRVMSACGRQLDRRARADGHRTGIEDGSGLGMVPGRGGVADIQLERLDSAEAPAPELR